MRKREVVFDEALYDEICSVLTEYEDDVLKNEIVIDEMYKLLVEIANAYCNGKETK